MRMQKDRILWEPLIINWTGQTAPLIQTQLNMSSLRAQWPYSQEPVHSSLVNLEDLVDWQEMLKPV